VAEVHPRVVAATRELLAEWRGLLDAGERRVGWKLGYGCAEIEAAIGNQPVLGYLTSATLIEPGGTFDAAGTRELRWETEVAVEVGRSDTVAGLAVALELVDVARPPDDLEGIVAGNVAHRALVLGPTRQAQGDYDWVVRSAGEILAAAGERLEPGDLILSGSITHEPAAPGDKPTAAVEDLGSVEVAIV
jgi:2-keto-4-pentenoate hydratase